MFKAALVDGFDDGHDAAVIDIFVGFDVNFVTEIIVGDLC